MGTLPLFLPFLDDSVVALVYCSTHSLLATSLTSGFSLSIPMLSDDSQFHSRTCLIASLPPSILSICQWFPRVCRHISCFHKFNSTMCLSLCSPPPYGVEEDEELVRVRNQFTTAITSNFYFRWHPTANSRMNVVKVWRLPNSTRLWPRKWVYNRCPVKTSNWTRHAYLMLCEWYSLWHAM
jgi:hypothetical protein